MICRRTVTAGPIPDQCWWLHAHQSCFCPRVKEEDRGLRTENHETHTETSQICLAALQGWGIFLTCLRHRAWFSDNQGHWTRQTDPHVPPTCARCDDEPSNNQNNSYNYNNTNNTHNYTMHLGAFPYIEFDPHAWALIVGCISDIAGNVPHPSRRQGIAVGISPVLHPLVRRLWSELTFSVSMIRRFDPLR